MLELVGETLGPYQITERIGRGGMANVYKAMHTSLAVPRALKVILPELVISEDFRARFQKEAQSVAALRHQHIVQVHDFGSQNNLYYMVMEFVAGDDLRRMLKAEGRIRPLVRAVELVQQVASALEYAHIRGLIHRDIKPENIMVDAAGQAILTDFGIAKLLHAGTQLTQTGASIGTPAYMPPEQAMGTAEIGPATDVYALTVVLYELLTGQVPFTADTPVGVVIKTLNDPLPLPQSLCPDIGDAVQDVIVKGTAKSLDQRYHSITEFRAALTAAIARDEAAGNRRTTPQVHAQTRTLARAPAASSRGRYAAVIGGIVAAAALGAGLIVWNSAHHSEVTATNVVAPSTHPAVAPPANETGVVMAAEPTMQSPIPLAAPAQSALEPVNKPAPTSDKLRREPIDAALAKRTKPISDPPLARDPVLASAPSSKEQVEPKAVSSAPAAVPVAQATIPATQPTAAVASTPPETGGDPNQVRKGVTTQRDLLRLFGGPNLTSYDDAGREVWIYESTATQTDTQATSRSSAASANLGLFFKSVDVGASASREQSAGTARTATSIRSITVTVTFAADRTVAEYTSRATYF